MKKQVLFQIVSTILFLSTVSIVTVNAQTTSYNANQKYHKFFTPDGVVNMGVRNGTYAHITTDASLFFLNVGIGTDTPDNELDVKGAIRAEEMFCQLGWSDYVFYDDYDLPTLEEEEKHIEENGHLLGFESEKDMEGMIPLADVSRRQQAKIEEMMLHLIELKKGIDELTDKVEELKDENHDLKQENEELKDTEKQEK